MSSEASIRSRLKPQYIVLFEMMGISRIEAEKTFNSMIQKAKEASTRKQTGNMDSWDKLLAIAETGSGMHADIEWKGQEGVREEDFQWWWNMPDLERQMIILSDEMNIMGYYEALRQSGKSKEETLHEVKITHPTFIEFSAWIPGQRDENSFLPIELKARVLAFQERQAKSDPTNTEWSKRKVEAGSANAAIRNEIKNGSL